MFHTISGMNAQAEAFAHYLQLCCDFSAEGRDIDTTPYFNCRERGFVITLRAKNKYKHFAWFEHRNSDSLCVVAWDSKTGFAKQRDFFTTADIPDAAYPSKWSVTKSFPSGSFGAASEWLYAEVKSFYEALAA